MKVYIQGLTEQLKYECVNCSHFLSSTLVIIIVLRLHLVPYNSFMFPLSLIAVAFSSFLFAYSLHFIFQLINISLLLIVLIKSLAIIVARLHSSWFGVVLYRFIISFSTRIWYSLSKEH